MFKRVINNLNVFLSRCPTSAMANFGGSGMGQSKNGVSDGKLSGVNEQIILGITHLITSGKGPMCYAF